MVNWNSSGGSAGGKVERIIREGSLKVPDTKFTINAEENDPAVLIRLYRGGKETETLVGHKMSTLSKTYYVEKHASHNQASHGRGGGASGAGGGTESAGRPIDSKRDNNEVSEAMDDVADIRTELNGMKDPDDYDNYIDDLSDDDSQIIDSALDDLQEVEDNLNGSFDSKTTSAHLNGIENAQTRLGDTYDALRNADNRNLESLTNKVEAVEERLSNYTDLFLEGDANKSKDKPLRKHGSHNQASHGRGGGGGGSGGGGTATSQMKSAVNAASSIAIKEGDVKMKDVAYSATKNSDLAAEKVKAGDYSGAKEYMDKSHDQLQSLPKMAEDAGLPPSVVSKLSTHAASAKSAHSEFYRTDKKVNDLSIKMFNLKQSMPVSVRTGKNTPEASKYRADFSSIVDQAAGILGTSPKEAFGELNTRMGVGS